MRRTPAVAANDSSDQRSAGFPAMGMSDLSTPPMRRPEPAATTMTSNVAPLLTERLGDRFA